MILPVTSVSSKITIKYELSTAVDPY